MSWHFYSTPISEARERWVWVRESEDHMLVDQSDHSFRSYSACLADALAHGYDTAAYFEPA